MEIPGRGYSPSPIAYKQTIILPVGGQSGQALMAFDQSSGAVVWKKQDFQVTHSSPILIEFSGQPQLVVFMAEALAGLNPQDGALLWRHEHPTQYGANLATPVWDGKDRLFCSAAYDSGSRCIKLIDKAGTTATEELWYSKKMRIHHGNVILEGGYAYGSSGDFGPAFFMCADLNTGKLLWRRRGFAKSTCVYSKGHLVILDQEGQLALAKITPEGMDVLSRCKIAEPYAWAAPTLVGSTLYVRDREHIMAFDLS
jgi:outer membrane protein assembly factor BamB